MRGWVQVDLSPERKNVKSHASTVLEVWAAMSFDCAALCATPISEHVRDISRVENGIRARGLGFLTLDLPHLDQLLLRLLEDGYVDFKGPLTARRSKCDTRPRFLWSLWSLVCDANGCLSESPSEEAIFAIRQLSTFQKKVEVGCSEDRVDNTVKEYLRNDAQIVPPSLNWDGDSLDLSVVPTFLRNFGERPQGYFGDEPEPDYDYRGFLRRLDLVSGILISELGYFDSMSEQSMDQGILKHGPGAVSNLRGMEYKYSFPSWSEKLEGVFPFDWCSGDRLGSVPPSRSEPPSRLIAVPKTAKAPRLIAAEPVEHQFCQQKVFSWIDASLRGSLAGSFLDLHDQSLSQEMVVRASIGRELSTLDLSSASDLVSCRHIESLLRSNLSLLEAAHATRTRYVRDDVRDSGFIKLKKFASMGSTLTFPLESLFFLCVALASAGAANRSDILRLRGKVRVFGDDIIVPTSAYNDTCTFLTKLGLKVNVEKSFSRGYFRESCGQDSYRGTCVTPVKPKVQFTGAARNMQAIVDLANNLHMKGLWRAGEKVMNLLPSQMRRNVFSYKRAVPGLKTFGAERIGKTRFCKHLHVTYVRVPLFLERQERIALDIPATLREHFTRVHSVFQPRVLGVAKRPKAVMAFGRVEITPIPAN